MFGAEPPLRLSHAELKEFDEYAAARVKAAIFSALKVFSLLAVNIVCIVPFLAGYPLHRHWDVARYLVLLAMGLFLRFVLKMGGVWASWQSSRETRREFHVVD